MAKIDKLNVETSEILWSDRKRILGMPISFTKYSIDEERLYIKKGFFRIEQNEILLYRILDIKTTRTLGQRLFGVGTVVLYSADQTDRNLELKNVKKPAKLHRYLSDLIETNRRSKGIAGREIVGMASMDSGVHDDDCHHDAPPPMPVHDCACDDTPTDM